MSEIKIVIDKRGPLGSDGTSYTECHFDKFEETPTLQEFYEHLSCGPESGHIYVNNHCMIGFGSIHASDSVNPNWSKIKDRQASLKRYSGGWGRYDYYLVIEGLEIDLCPLRI